MAKKDKKAGKPSEENNKRRKKPTKPLKLAEGEKIPKGVNRTHISVDSQGEGHIIMTTSYDDLTKSSKIKKSAGRAKPAPAGKTKTPKQPAAIQKPAKSKVKLIKGKSYRENNVLSQQGYEDWEYTGITKQGPKGKLYAFSNDRGTCWFDANDLKEFTEKKQSKTNKPVAGRAKSAPAGKTKKPKLIPIKHSDAEENKIGGESPIHILKSKSKEKPKQSRSRILKRVAKSGGYTVFDGKRAGKTFATPEEAANYAAYMLLCTGEVLEVAPTQRQITHTFKTESEKK